MQSQEQKKAEKAADRAAKREDPTATAAKARDYDTNKLIIDYFKHRGSGSKWEPKIRSALLANGIQADRLTTQDLDAARAARSPGFAEFDDAMDYLWGALGSAESKARIIQTELTGLRAKLAAAETELRNAQTTQKAQPNQAEQNRVLRELIVPAREKIKALQQEIASRESQAPALEQEIARLQSRRLEEAKRPGLLQTAVGGAAQGVTTGLGASVPFVLGIGAIVVLWPMVAQHLGKGARAGIRGFSDG